MRPDYRIAILLAVAAFPSGAALMVASEYLHLNPTAVFATFWGGIAIFLLLIAFAVRIALRGESKEPPVGHKRRMIALIGMTVCAVGLVGFAAMFFWPAPKSHSISEVAQPQTVNPMPEESYIKGNVFRGLKAFDNKGVGIRIEGNIQDNIFEDIETRNNKGGGIEIIPNKPTKKDDKTNK